MDYVCILGEMHDIEGRAWCYDRCMSTIDDPHMQFDIVIIVSTEHNTCTVQSQCTSNSAAIYMMVLKICTDTYFMKTGILTVK